MFDGSVRVSLALENNSSGSSSSKEEEGAELQALPMNWQPLLHGNINARLQLELLIPNTDPNTHTHTPGTGPRTTIGTDQLRDGRASAWLLRDY